MVGIQVGPKNAYCLLMLLDTQAAFEISDDPQFSLTSAIVVLLHVLQYRSRLTVSAVVTAPAKEEVVNRGIAASERVGQSEGKIVSGHHWYHQVN